MDFKFDGLDFTDNDEINNNDEMDKKDEINTNDKMNKNIDFLNIDSNENVNEINKNLDVNANSLNDLDENANDLKNLDVNAIDKCNNVVENKRELVKQFVEDIHKKLDEMKSHVTLVIDRIEGNIAVCEDRETEEITNINITELPEDIHEGDVLKLINDKYEIDEQTKLEIQERIKNKIINLFEETEEE